MSFISTWIFSVIFIILNVHFQHLLLDISVFCILLQVGWVYFTAYGTLDQAVCRELVCFCYLLCLLRPHFLSAYQLQPLCGVPQGTWLTEGIHSSSVKLFAFLFSLCLFCPLPCFPVETAQKGREHISFVPDTNAKMLLQGFKYLITAIKYFADTFFLLAFRCLIYTKLCYILSVFSQNLQ